MYSIYLHYQNKCNKTLSPHTKKVICLLGCKEYVKFTNNLF